MGTRLGSLAALVVLALAALVSATHDGPVWEAGRFEGERSSDSSEEAPPPSSEDGTREPDRGAPDEPPRFDDAPFTAPITIVVLALVIGAVVAILVAVGLRLVLLQRRRLSGDQRPRSGAAPVPDTETEESEPEQLDASIGQALQDLAVGEPRNAIVAMWHHLERALHSDRFRRHPADTPTEYAERARASYTLDDASLDELAALYREARFSRHPITERHRDRARACLARLQQDLRMRVP